jgi:hypothetical protein
MESQSPADAAELMSSILERQSRWERSLHGTLSKPIANELLAVAERIPPENRCRVEVSKGHEPPCTLSIAKQVELAAQNSKNSRRIAPSIDARA